MNNCMNNVNDLYILEFVLVYFFVFIILLLKKRLIKCIELYWFFYFKCLVIKLMVFVVFINLGFMGV